MSIFLKSLKGVSRVLLYVGYAAILVLLGMTVFDVIARYVFGRPNSGVTELSQMMLIISMTVIAHSIVEGRLISVGVIVDRFPKRLNFAFVFIMGGLAIFFFLVVGWQLIVMTQTSFATGEAYFVIKTPRWPMYGILGVTFLASVLSTIVYIIEQIQHYTPPEEKTVFDENPDLAILAIVDEEDKAKGGAL